MGNDQHAAAGVGLGHALALVLGLYQMLAMEYFFLLELLRPVVIWLALGGCSLPARARLKRTVLNWLPYLAAFGAAFIWRAFFFNFQTENYRMVFLEQLREEPGAALVQLLVNIGKSLWVVIVQAWGTVFRIPDVSCFGDEDDHPDRGSDGCGAGAGAWLPVLVESRSGSMRSIKSPGGRWALWGWVSWRCCWVACHPGALRCCRS